MCGNAEVAAPHPNDDPVCASRLCRQRYAAVARESLCRGCRRPLSWAHRPRGYCDDAQCRLSSVRDARDRRVAELREAAARRQGVPGADAYPLLDLPSQRAPITRLPSARRAQFRAYLEAQVERARRPVTDPGDGLGPADDNVWSRAAPPPVADVTQRAVIRGCTLCKGYCCTSGAPHAWLDAATMRRQIALHPQRSTSDIVDAYMAAIGPRTYRDSCVYHGTAGCSLAPDMRSDICNHYFCKPMLRFREGSAAVESVKVFIVVRDRGRRELGTFVREEGEPQAAQ